ncbi:MAG: heterocyst differentiation protein HetZ [Cyanobacteria bacterium P01_C01_bin.89]
MQDGTKTPQRICVAVAERIADEVNRICTESKRIQNSGEVDVWMKDLSQHRLRQCLNYYKHGSKRGRAELHSTLSAIIYRYIAPARTRASYQARLTAIEDFLQGFYVEALKAFRRECQMPQDYSPRAMLELAEYLAFVERYAKRRIPLPRGRSQQLVILRAQTFARQTPPETSIDMERAAESGGVEGDSYTWDDASVQQVRQHMGAQEQSEVMDSALRSSVVNELVEYLTEKKQKDCIDYLVLRLQDLPASEIEQVLGLTARQRDYLQQRFKYHLLRFAMLHRWELVHQWLDADLEKDLGLTPVEWEGLLSRLDDKGKTTLKLKQEQADDRTIAETLGVTITQAQKVWFGVLETAWEIRNSNYSNPD